MLDMLEKHGPGHPGFPARLRQFIAIGRAHIEFEETQVWGPPTGSGTRWRAATGTEARHDV